MSQLSVFAHLGEHALYHFGREIIITHISTDYVVAVVSGGHLVWQAHWVESPLVQLQCAPVVTMSLGRSLIMFRIKDRKMKPQMIHDYATLEEYALEYTWFDRPASARAQSIFRLIPLPERN